MERRLLYVIDYRSETGNHYSVNVAAKDFEDACLKVQSWFSVGSTIVQVRITPYIWQEVYV